MKKYPTSPLVETSWLAEILGEPELRILDCSVVGQPNDDGTYTFKSQLDTWRTARIPGSVYVDIPNQLSDQDHHIPLMMPAPEKFAEIMKSIGVGDNSLVVLYDRSNHAWATRVWWMLKVCGFDNAYVLNGGWNKWHKENQLEAQGHFEFFAAESFTIKHHPELLVDKERVLQAMEDKSITLLNSLPKPIFTGEVSPYARAGRITGSENLSCESIVDPDSGCYLDIGKIRRMASETGVFDSTEVITYCGGGIAASSTAFALTMLGLEKVAIYDGSLSEWTADPDLPMETGQKC